MSTNSSKCDDNEIFTIRQYIDNNKFCNIFSMN